MLLQKGNNSMNYAVEVKNISKKINGKEILKNITFNIEKNKVVGIVGQNGAGKSTLLKVMTGLYKMDKGEILYNGISLKKNYENAIKNVGSVIENPDMYRNLTGYDNLEIFKSMFKGVDENVVKEIVKIVNIEKNLGKKFKTYSLGMKERLGLASALINKPEILILDEPTNGLDPKGIKELREFIKSLNDTTVIISSHMLYEIEAVCDEVLFIKNGEIISKKELNKSETKKYIEFEVDNYSKAKLILDNYVVCEELKFYASDEEIGNINKDFILNGINVYRITEINSLEDEFISKMGE